MSRPGDVMAPIDDDLRPVLRLLGEPANGGVLLIGPDRADFTAALVRALGERAGVVVPVRGPTSADDVLDAAAAALVAAAETAGHPPAHPWHAFATPLRNRAHPWRARYQLLSVHVLANWPVMLLFEDADANLTDQGTFRDVDLGALAASWIHDPGRGRVLLTSSVPLALPTNPHRPLRVHHL